MRSFIRSAALLAGAVVVISGCQESISPESEGPLLHTAPVLFSAVMTVLDIRNEEECLTELADETQVFDGCRIPLPVTGDLVGPGRVIFDGILDAAGGGEGEGPLRYNACVAPDVCGIFEGRVEGEFTGELFSGTFRLKGKTGGVKGIKIRGTLIERPETDILDLVGTLRFPT